MSSRSKRRKEEAEALENGRVYDEFIASFQDNSCMTFVRGGVQNDTSTSTSSGGTYRMDTGRKRKSSVDVNPFLVKAAQLSSSQPSKRRRRSRTSSESKKRNMDSFLEELKNKHDNGKEETNSSSYLMSSSKGSYDNGDPTTTNLHVGNLAPTVTENVLADVFRKYGPIHSLKIMWPRGEEQSHRKHNSGFVSFKRRRDAEDAKFHLNGKKLEGNTMRIDWGKSVSRNRIRREPNSSDKKIVVSYPDSKDVRKRIDTLATYVARDGEAFEKIIRERERENSEFAFLRDDSNESRFYRWRVWSLVNGDSVDRWLAEPFQILSNGAFWIPPDPRKDPHGRKPKDFLTGRAREREREQRERERRERLSEKDSKRFRDLLNEMSMSRASVRNAMIFALDHAEAANDIIKALESRLCDTKDSAPNKVAYLYVVSDILYNSNNSSKTRHFRTILKDRLPTMFEGVAKTYQSLKSRFNSNQMRSRVQRILDVWREWSSFPPLYLIGLESALDRSCYADEDFETELASCTLSETQIKELIRRSKLTGLPHHNRNGKEMLRELHRVNLYSRSKFDVASSSSILNKDFVGGLRSRDVDGVDDNVMIDGDPIDGDPIDGDPIDGDPIDGDPIDGDPIDGDPIDGDPIDGDPIDGDPIDL